jgi:multidrug efflux pump subunit AcrB
LDFQNYNPFEYRFYSDDMDCLRTVAERMAAYMRKNPNLMNVHTDWQEPRPLIEVTLDPVATSQLGINRTTAELQLALSTGTAKVGQVWEGDYELPVVMKDSADLTFSDVQNLGLSTSQTMLSTALPTFLGGSSGGNATVKLRQVARVEPQWSETRIMHRGGERCLTVTAQLAHGAYASKVEQQVADIMHNDVRLPEGVRSQVGGEMEYDGEALPQIFGGVGIAMIIIFFFLLANFKKYGITSVCMISLALMLPGALLGLGLMNRTLGLTSVMGFITLMGMIMRNEILIFEHANDLVRKFVESHPKPEEVNDEMKEAYRREYNEAVRQAAYDAGRRRMVPIFLTTATTAVGVVPMILAQSSFWMPVGVTIFAGGIGSLIMVVSVLPVVYWKVSLK